jgi:ferredoxin
VTGWVLPDINLLLCNRCGTCVDRCPASAVEMRTEGPFVSRPHDCTYCARCDALCPQGAITCTYEIIWGTDDEA